jgi:hypothetical protein
LSCGSGSAENKETRSDLAGEVVIEYLTQAREWNALEDELLGAVPSKLPYILDSKLLAWKWDPSMGSAEEQRTKFLEEASEQSALLLEAAEDFLSKNQKPHHISKLGPLSLDHVIVDFPGSEGLSPLDSFPIRSLSEEEWRNGPYSSDYYSLSVPGFSSDGTVAVMYASWFLHGLAANGSVEVFVRENGKWVESDWHLYFSWYS